MRQFHDFLCTRFFSTLGGSRTCNPSPLSSWICKLSCKILWSSHLGSIIKPYRPDGNREHAPFPWNYLQYGSRPPSEASVDFSLSLQCFLLAKDFYLKLFGRKLLLNHSSYSVVCSKNSLQSSKLLFLIWCLKRRFNHLENCFQVSFVIESLFLIISNGL